MSTCRITWVAIVLLGMPSWSRADGPFFDAVRTGRLEEVKRLLAQGWDVNQPSASGKTALMVAARSGRLRAFDLLISYGAEVDALDSYGYTALTRAAGEGHADIVQALIDHGARLDFPLRRTTPLILAAERGHDAIVEMLITAGANVDIVRLSGTALTKAARHGHVPVVDRLVRAGADPQPGLVPAIERGQTAVVAALLRHGVDAGVMRGGKTMLLMARLEGHDDIVALLEAHLAGKDTAPQSKSPEARTPSSGSLHDAAIAGDIDGTLSQLSLGATLKPATLVEVVRAGHAPVCRLLLKHAEVHIDARGRLGQTPLTCATRGERLDMVYMLLWAGADPDLPDLTGDTPLQLAIDLAQPELVEALLKYGASPHRTVMNEPPLVYAILSDNQPAAVELLRHGADAHACAVDGTPAIMLAQRMGHRQVFSILRAAGAKPRRLPMAALPWLVGAVISVVVVAALILKTWWGGGRCWLRSWLYSSIRLSGGACSPSC